MAASIMAHSVLGKISKDHLECPICTDRFKDPKVLDCLHSFCMVCLNELKERQDPQDTFKIPCPLCRQETALKENGVTDLPNDFKLSALVEEVTLQEKLMEGQGSQVKCQACDEEDNQAVSQCMDCNHLLCHKCQRQHERMTLMKSHKIYMLAQLRSGEITYKSKIRDYIPKCGKHPDQNLNIYCNTCQQLECTTCTVLDHGKPKHDLIGIPEALDKCKQEVEELVAKVESSKADIITAMKEASESRNKLESAFADTKKKISQKVAKELARIREEEQTLEQEADKIFKDRIKIFETAEATNSNKVSQADNKLYDVNRLIDQGSSHEIVDLKQKLIHNLDELTGKQPEKVSVRLSIMDFEEDERSLGRLVLQDKQQSEVESVADASSRPETLYSKQNWELKKELTTLPEFKHVTAFCNNDIVVADAYHNQLISIGSADNKSKCTGLIYPSRFQVNKDDQIIFVDEEAVKIFNRNYQLLHQFTPERMTDTGPSCLAVDDNNLIAVGYRDKEEISLHNTDGSFIRALPALGISEYLTIYKQRLIYTNTKGKMLLSVDYNGDMVFSVDMKTGYPYGVCCDSDGSIYVAVCEEKTKTSSDEIQHYSPAGKYIGCVIKDCGDPYGMTFTPGGNLVVAAGESVKIYHRV